MTRAESLPLAARRWRPVRALFDPRDSAAAPVAILGVTLIASGLFHLAVWWLDGSAWSGPVSFRKPVVFGLSVGLLSLSLAWVLGHLPSARARRALSWTYTVAMAVEVALITMQAWRRVGSHFNNRTPFDGLVFTAMGIAIFIASVNIAVWTVQVLRARHLEQDLRWAMAGGLVLVCTSMAVGQLMVLQFSSASIGAAVVPSMIAPAGQLKIPHAVTVHGLQVLPILLLLLTRRGVARAARVRWMRVATLGYATLGGATLLQALAGRAPMDLTAGMAILHGLGALALIAPLLVTRAGLVATEPGSDVSSRVLGGRPAWSRDR